MEDVMKRNVMVATGTPTLTTGALTLDTNQGLTFNGASHFMQATDSTSLSVTGAMSLECFFKCSSLPGSTQTIFGKASSYVLQINSAGKILWRLDNGASNVTVTSNATISTGTWYHLVGVYNDNYAGAQQFGETAAGASTMTLADTGANKMVGKFTLQESAILNTITAKLEYFDEIWAVQACAVVYADSGGVPTSLITHSDVVTLYPPNPDWRTMTDVEFPLTPAVVAAGNYNIGLITDTIAGIDKPAIRVSLDTSGGDLNARNDSVSSPSDPFGTPTTSNDDVPTIWCDYTAIGRTGDEGKAILFINGAEDNSSAYTADIGDNANALQQSPASAFSVDEPAIYGRALSPVEVATHYLAR